MKVIRNEDKIIDLKTFVFTFGKYKGSPIEDVLEHDANYVLWCHDNIDWFNLSVMDYDVVDQIAIEEKDGFSDWEEHYGDSGT